MADWIGIAALVISLLTYVLSVHAQKHTVKQDYVGTLEARVDKLEGEIKDLKEETKRCEDARDGLLKERVLLLTEVVRLQHKLSRTGAKDGDSQIPVR